jgi:hypothetical protein
MTDSQRIVMEMGVQPGSPLELVARGMSASAISSAASLLSKLEPELEWPDHEGNGGAAHAQCVSYLFSLAASLERGD